MATMENPPKVDALQQIYIELLEKRIAQLEAAVNQSASKDAATDSEDDSPRYRNILRMWDKKAGAFKDTLVGAKTFITPETKNTAYTFRRVYNPDTGEKGAYSEIEIEDEKFIQLLKTHIGKYPGVNFDGDKVYIPSPFAAIIHKWEKLQEVAKETPRDQAHEDLANLLERVETAPELQNYFKLRESYISSKVVTFETLWTIFAPGELIVARPYMKRPQILRVNDSPIPFSLSKSYKYLVMWAWCWDWDGRKMIKVQYRFKFENFRGTKPITELPSYPLGLHDGVDDLKVTILKESRTFINATALCKPGAGQMFRYNGLAYADRRQILGQEESIEVINGEIIADAQAFLQHASGVHALGELADSSFIYIDVQQKSSEEASDFSKLLRSLPQEGPLDSSNEDFLLLPPRLLGYATREKIWGQFSLEYTEKSLGEQKEKFENDLQLDMKYKNLIQALVRSHQQGQTKGTSDKQVEDVVAGKGKGLVLLLHGPPGVGKTLTAETIAEATGKPLVVVSVAEIGLDASKAERSLNRLFSLATKWEAVLLVDEADVFLETRGATSDASRNALVSVLLRVLEYYQGIIILTTNRIKSIDVAVISRIHLAIRYEDLTDVQMRSIFKYFLDRLGDDLIKNRAEIDHFVSSYGHHYGLNGRQIRNVVYAALAAARHEMDHPEKAPHRYPPGRPDGRLTADHLKEVCDMTRQFQEQLKENTMQQRYANEVPGRSSGYRAF
ncbi:hypothetical protein JX266_013200 [Neoarthrinium moseri]|uniref:uncharacterized protein n=1 Tax=Neoarthrinium moseri TaxID=1658444 RepID=UPI001FDB7525|nr:uncharacterized protein JN550_003536 [Neoarthrinium moseri]KAI1840596.1 hypothetical protein JX266_013200 [Neoarthrinium moseri]KAI1873283.1 hypothetical protein JN550_003536 [Neoarthrinium moseri]